MPVNTLLLVYVVVLLVAIVIVTALFDIRWRRFAPRPSDDRIFRCDKCRFVYTDDPDVDRSRCPQCGQMNEPVTF